MIIPVGFFSSSRDVDIKCRSWFLERYRVIRVNYFEESVFDDTTTTVVSFVFLKNKNKELITSQKIEWVRYPIKEKKIFDFNKNNKWMIGGDYYVLPTHPNISFSRYVIDVPIPNDRQLTYLTLIALDSGTRDGRIKILYDKNFKYDAKESSRAYATLIINGKLLTDEQQKLLASKFNDMIEKARTETWSLFLSNYRESKEYARKRISFELAYRLLSYLCLSIH